MYDFDDDKREEIGTLETTLGKIMGSKAQTISVELKIDGKNGRGTITIRAVSQKEDPHPAPNAPI